ncbi:carboxypeptidase-like regulatory domain-containing protein [Blastopirellula marina]|uniref:Carboxypeptidase regulatory-like domain-containing protein n=1 Tax=Blastopirellula marina TaxID=124 RepID=A0A2S8FA80_9BACT|nr:carboxypeptidase-like regulatory domain-containing protein [Blastopirellula marina]PQO28844.1 hypothetical protein C5Y98_24060 [Blastopirellula marina]PTL42117.1 hypothetical protein C5Y97_24075 [Blastopirellula marina]
MNGYVMALRLIFLVTLWLPIGCNSGPTPPDNLPTLHPVKLKLLQDGMPLADASVRLVPNGERSSWYSGGTTDADGIVAIKTHGQFLGAPEGSYRVTISKIEMPEAATSTLEDLNKKASQGSTFDLVDPKFGNPAKTTLRLEVAAESNEQEFDLGPAVRTPRKGPPG